MVPKTYRRNSGSGLIHVLTALHKWASEMAQQGEVIEVQPGDLSLIPQDPYVKIKREN